MDATFSSPDKPVDPSTTPRDILDTNEPPAESNLPSIREFVSRGSARRAFLDAKIGPLKAELDKLLEERDFLDTEIRRHEGAVSPLRRMPPEIISLIFTLAAPPAVLARNSMESYLMNFDEGPCALTAVSSRWRNIALSQPSLWTCISLDFTDERPDSPSIAGLVPMVRAYLERSQQLPLDITFRPFFETRCTEVEQSALDLIAHHSDRWETVTFSGSPSMYEALAGIRNHLPILRRLDITVHPELEEAVLDISDLFQSCPALQEAFINAGGGEMPVSADLPYTQLLRYSASNPWTNHAHVLRSATNLVDCVLHLTGRMHVSPGSPPILLPQLRRLSISKAGVLHRLETPALQELYCCDHSSNLHSFLKRLPNLQRLFVGDTQSAADIGSLLHAAPTITSLMLYLPMAFASDLFSLLENPTPTSNSVSTPVIPNVHTIAICLYPGLGLVDQDQLMRAAEAQWQGGGLRSLHLYAMKFTPSAATLGRMEGLREEGMKIELYQNSKVLYETMVPLDFQLYEDHCEILEMFASNDDFA
jgi:hypothetical protein